MKTQVIQRRETKGYVLLVTLGLTTGAALLLAGALDWSSQNAKLTDRNNEYFTTLYAAEAATEMVLTSVNRDYKNYGEGLVYSKLSTYATSVPSVNHGSYWSDYEFSNGAGTINRLFMKRIKETNSIVLGPPHQGLMAMGATYQIIANAKNKNTRNKIQGAVGQEIHLGTIPIFQFAIFYEEDLEINPGPAMNVHGFVHSNSRIYSKPGDILRFYDNVSASEAIEQKRKPGDPTPPGSGSIDFRDYHLSGISPLKLPVGTNTTGDANNISDNVHAILERPPSDELVDSPAGMNRLFNKADLTFLVFSNGVVVAESGVLLNDSATTIPAEAWRVFLKTNSTFYNKREDVLVQAVTLNVDALKKWSASNQIIRPVLLANSGGVNGDVSSIYIKDMRPTSNSVLVTNFTISTNYVVVTNTTPTVSSNLPATGTYLGSVNNTTTSHSKNPPGSPAAPPAMNVVTNTTYIDDATSAPAAGTYVGSVTTNGKTGNKKRWRYYKITSFSYKLPAYAYNKITGTATNLLKMTNYFFSTNWNIYAQSGIVVENGEKLPPRGLTVVTPDPLYVRGHYNTKNDSGGTAYGSDTTHTRPAAFMADAVTILSTAWDPENSDETIGNRVAANTTVNAAILSGIVPTGNGYYSGGVENFPRFLEKWSGKTFTYNGSMVCMFDSLVATAPWIYGGDYYEAPNRNWTFDQNFNDPLKLPPLTPQVISTTRGRWSLLAPNTSSF